MHAVLTSRLPAHPKSSYPPPQELYSLSLTRNSTFKDFLLIVRAAEGTGVAGRVPPGQLLQREEARAVEHVRAGQQDGLPPGLLGAGPRGGAADRERGEADGALVGPPVQSLRAGVGESHVVIRPS